jgi:hypothetical protein
MPVRQVRIGQELLGGVRLDAVALELVPKLNSLFEFSDILLSPGFLTGLINLRPVALVNPRETSEKRIT